MSHLSQATPQSVSSTRRCGYTDASGSIDESRIISDPWCVDQCTTAYHRSQTPPVPDVPNVPTSSCGAVYGSASDWLEKKNFGTSGRQRSDSHLSQRRRSSATLPYPSPDVHKEQPAPENIDAWFKQHFETPDQQVTPRRVRDNTLIYLEHSSYPGAFHVYFRGQPGISIQTLLSKWRFDRSDTPLSRLVNFRLVNPPIRFKLPDMTFAQHSAGGIKVSDSMTIYDFCTKVAGKMGTSLDQWDIKDLAIVSLELAQDSVICYLGTAHSPVIEHKG